MIGSAVTAVIVGLCLEFLSVLPACNKADGNEFSVLLFKGIYMFWVPRPGLHPTNTFGENQPRSLCLIPSQTVRQSDKAGKLLTELIIHPFELLWE